MFNLSVQLLENDLAARGINRRQLAAQLSVSTGKPMTEQAVGLWFARNKIPSNRYSALVDLLGPDSEVAQALSGRFAADSAPTVGTPRAPNKVGPSLSPEAQLLGEWLDKIPDELAKNEAFQACSAVISQARRSLQTASPEPSPSQSAKTPT
jgi:hypothetical protein